MNVQILWRLAFLMVFNGHSIFVWITVLTINRCGYILFDWWWPAVDTTESVGDDNYPLREVIRTNQYNDREIWTMLIRTSHWSGQRVFCGLRRVFSPLVLIQGGLWRARQIWWPLQRKSSAIHSPFSKEVLAKRVRGDLCCEGVFPPARTVWLWSYVRFSWHETFGEHFCARLSQLFHLRAWQALYFARDAKTLQGLARDEVVSEVIFVFFCGRRSIWWTWTMFWADLNSSRHRFVNIRYFSACHDFAWQVQDSARFRMPQAIFFWGGAVLWRKIPETLWYWAASFSTFLMFMSRGECITGLVARSSFWYPSRNPLLTLCVCVEELKRCRASAFDCKFVGCLIYWIRCLVQQRFTGEA